MKVVIYGIGRKYSYFFDDLFFIEREILENGIDIIGFSDGNKNIWGNKITYYNQIFQIKNIEEFQNTELDRIIVTSKDYFDEIKEELIVKGFGRQQILLMDQFYDSYVEKLFHIEKIREKDGIEIGGPSDLLSYLYINCRSCDNVNFSSDTVWSKNKTKKYRYGNKDLGRFWIAEATELSEIQDERYDFVLSSNNLEHIANPLKALKEFSRVVKRKGIVVVLVPMKEKTFDHNRTYTTYEHLLEDYIHNMGENDLSHLSEIIEKHDYDMDIWCGGKEKFIERAWKNIENRCLHQHVFNKESLWKSIEFAGLKVIEFTVFRGNWMIIGEK